MSKKTVKHEVDLANLPPLSDKQKAELAALAACTDGNVDYSDMPPLTAEFWKNAERGKFSECAAFSNKRSTCSI